MDNFSDEEAGVENETPKQICRPRGPTIMFDVTRIRSLGEKKVVMYNEDGVPIGENGAKLKSFIGSATHYHVPITYSSWKSVPVELKDKIFSTVEAAFVIDPRSRKNIIQTAGISFRQFKCWLTTKYIMPHKDEPQLLQVPPEKYSFIDQHHWTECLDCVKLFRKKDFSNKIDDLRTSITIGFRGRVMPILSRK
ncbi:hypothetical protein Csa_016979, partial [Cucumis sativus]